MKLEPKGEGTTALDGSSKPRDFAWTSRNSDNTLQNWSPSVENFVVVIFGKDFRVVVECATEREVQMSKTDLVSFFGPGSAYQHKMKDIQPKKGQWYLALAALTFDKNREAS